MDKYKVFANGLEHNFQCDCSSDYIKYSDFLFDILDVCPQITIIHCDFDFSLVSDSEFELACKEKELDNRELLSA